MKVKKQTPPKRRRKPRVVHGRASSIEELLRHTDPSPDEETERFVEAIYAYRRASGREPSPE